MQANATTPLATRFGSIQSRLMLIFLLIGIVPALLIGLVGQRQASQALEERVGSDLDSLAFSVVDKLDRNLFERYADVQIFAASAEARSFLEGSVSRLMDRAMIAYAPSYRLMLLVDNRGNIRASNTIGPDGQPINASVVIGRNVSNEPWYRVWKESPLPVNTSFVQDMHANPLVAAVYGDEGYALAFSYPIYTADAQQVGVWVSFFNWDVTQLIIADTLKRPQADGATTMQITLVNAAGLPISGTGTPLDPNDKIDRSEFETLQTDAQDSSNRQFLRSDTIRWNGLLAGYARSQGYAKYAGLEWAAIVSQAPEEALAVANRLLWQIVTVGALVALIVVGVAVTFGRSTARPLLALTAGARRAAAGDLSQHVQIQRHDEIGALGHAFNTMITQLHGARDDLEQKVTDRTAALAGALDELRAGTAEREQLYTIMRQLSIPFVPLTEGIALLPLIGELDSARAAHLLQTVLGGIEAQRMKVLLLDITGVPVVDTAVARVLLQTATAARLLGCELVLAGIRPEVAQTLVQLGVEFTNLSTRSTLQDALVYALHQAGYRISKQR